MSESSKTRAEQMYSASQKKADQFLKQKEKAWQESKDKVERLKALRLAKETADREALEAANASVKAGSKKKSKKTKDGT